MGLFKLPGKRIYFHDKRIIQKTPLYNVNLQIKMQVFLFLNRKDCLILLYESFFRITAQNLTI